MKKTFLARRNALLASTGVSWGALLFGLAVVLLLVRLIAPNAFLKVTSPVFRASDAFIQNTHLFFSSFNDSAALTLEKERLASENAVLALENEALREKLGATARLDDEQGIVAGVLARPPTSPYDTLVLSAGSLSGVTVGMEAFGEGGVPLGVVTSVLPDFSRVLLFSAPGTAIDGWAGSSKVPLTLRGAGAGAFTATAARSANIVVGDRVFVPGPGALPVGTVARIDSDSSSPSVEIRILPAINLFSVTWVSLRESGAVLLSVPAAESSMP